MKHTATSWGLRKDQGEKTVDTWDKQSSRTHNPGQRVASHHKLGPYQGTGQSSPSLSAMEVNREGLVQGSRVEQQSRDKNWLKVTDASQTQLGLREAWAQKTQWLFSPAHLLPGIGCAPRLKRKMSSEERVPVPVSLLRVSKRRKDSRGREQSPPHSIARITEPLIRSSHVLQDPPQAPQRGSDFHNVAMKK